MSEKNWSQNLTKQDFYSTYRLIYTFMYNINTLIRYLQVVIPIKNIYFYLLYHLFWFAIYLGWKQGKNFHNVNAFLNFVFDLTDWGATSILCIYCNTIMNDNLIITKQENNQYHFNYSGILVFCQPLVDCRRWSGYLFTNF